MLMTVSPPSLGKEVRAKIASAPITAPNWAKLLATHTVPTASGAAGALDAVGASGAVGAPDTTNAVASRSAVRDLIANML